MKGMAAPVLGSSIVPWDSSLYHKRCFAYFRMFLAIKVASPLAFSSFPFGWWEEFSLASLLVCCLAIWASLPQYFLPGLLGILGLSVYEVLHTWPFTINHAFLECIALIMLSLEAIAPQPQREDLLSPAHLIKGLMISVWFFSGLHKIFDGYYLNGEFFALELGKGDTALGARLGVTLQLVSQLFNLTPPQLMLSCCTVGTVDLATWQIIILFALSWLTIATEILLPIALFFPAIRLFALSGLFALQGSVAYYSNEIDFGFTAYAILLMFLPRYSHYSFPLVTGFYLGACPWG